MSEPLDGLSPSTHSDLKAMAQKHARFESFLQDMERLAETMWHNARRQSESDIQQALPVVAADAESEMQEPSVDPIVHEDPVLPAESQPV
jgi:hypothetical protein